ncbi:MAG: ATP-binding protein [Prevotella sp.]|nr:ATP-binding protein [Prevotella sp.]
MLVKTYSAAVMGLEATTITIETNQTKGMIFKLSGLADTAVRESYDRICAALPNIGFYIPQTNLTINLSPADMKKEGSGFDLPMAIGILAADGNIDTSQLDKYMMVGELGLDGSIKPVRAALPIAIRARKEKFKGLIVPKDNMREAAVVNNLDVYGMDNLADVVAFLQGRGSYEPMVVDTRKEFYEQQYSFDLDFADVKGQEGVKRALEVASAGGHNVIKMCPIIQEHKMLDIQIFSIFLCLLQPDFLQKRAA